MEAVIVFSMTELFLSSKLRSKLGTRLCINNLVFLHKILRVARTDICTVFFMYYILYNIQHTIYTLYMNMSINLLKFSINVQQNKLHNLVEISYEIGNTIYLFIWKFHMKKNVYMKTGHPNIRNVLIQCIYIIYTTLHISYTICILYNVQCTVYSL